MKRRGPARTRARARSEAETDCLLQWAVEWVRTDEGLALLFSRIQRKLDTGWGRPKPQSARPDLQATESSGAGSSATVMVSSPLQLRSGVGVRTLRVCLKS